ncbi:hypothetical protein VNI00_012816 [Paramarasmius palmivorus]|uniref:Cell division control protein 14 n=1 Tax=Paramarasmius palmivorus TaxID=297713 RepID=A0AAW0C438_9AGAR
MDIQIQDSLDTLLSSNESHHLKALESLESLFVHACLSKGDDLKWFSALQGTFECNVVSRLIPYLTHLPISQSHISHLTITTSLIQGIVLNHSPSKAWLGRPHPLSVLVELLLASRHLPDTSPNPHLSSTILDTLLCILVDSPPAIRAFEQVKGVEAVVRLLKRSGTGRGVRMKCLEFLYFYLLDETLEVPMLGASTKEKEVEVEVPVPTVPNTPTSSKTPSTTTKPASKPKPFISATPIRPPTSRYGSSTFSFSSGSEASGGTFSTSTLTPPDSRVPSASSTTSTSTSPKKPRTKNAIGLGRPSGPGTPRPRQRTQTPEPRTLGMLKRDVEFVPQSPAGVNPLLTTPAPAPRRTHGHVKAKSVGGVEVKKALSEGVVVGKNRLGVGAGMGRTSSLGSSFVTPDHEQEVEEDEDECRFWGSSPPSSTHSNSNSTPNPRSTSNSTAALISPPQSTVTSPTKASFTLTSDKENRLPSYTPHQGQIKTTAQKTAHLSTMLGNVDALVEGVRRAGIWGVS